MIKLIKKLLGLCDHKWVTIARISIVSGNDRNAIPIGARYELRCEHCGNLKQVKWYN